MRAGLLEFVVACGLSLGCSASTRAGARPAFPAALDLGTGCLASGTCPRAKRSEQVLLQFTPALAPSAPALSLGGAAAAQPTLSAAAGRLAADQPPAAQGLGQGPRRQRFKAVEQLGARIPAGGEVRLYIVGSSNVAWQTWPDQLHALLKGLGYAVPVGNYTLAELHRPMAGRAPVCDNAHEFDDLDTPRIGKVGWASWGFAYESTDDCMDGFRWIDGHRVSCSNGWGCREKSLFRPSAIAEEARGADVVLLSNWVNNIKQAWTGWSCFMGQAVDPLDTVGITLVTMHKLIAAIHEASPNTVVLVMAMYPVSYGNRVDERSLAATEALNARVKGSLEREPNTLFVDYAFPVEQAVFQKRNPGHANCRGDRAMAVAALKTLYHGRVLARGLMTPTPYDYYCFQQGNCSAIRTRQCCQMSVMCWLDSAGACVPYGPGTE